MRRRRRHGDAYIDDIVPDGQSVHVPMTLADAMMIDGIRAAHPPSGGGYHYGTGYCFGDAAARDRSAAAYCEMRDRLPALYRRDQASALRPLAGEGREAPGESSEPKQYGWPTSNSGNYPIWNTTVGAACKCPDGSPGKLVPHPNNSSILICQPSDDADEASDAASAADEAYYQMKDALSSEWQRRGPQRDQVSAPPPNQQPNNAWPQRQWPKGGYGADPLQHWPDPFTLQSQHEGDACTINGAPGHLEKHNGGFLCVPNGRDQAASNIAPSSAPVGGPWPEGCECDLGNGDLGLLVKQGDQLVCKRRDDFDAASVSRNASDSAYEQMVRRLSDEWRTPRRP